MPTPPTFARTSTTRRRAAAGPGYLEEWWQDYPRESLLHCHISWHIALWQLALAAPRRPGASTAPIFVPALHWAADQYALPSASFLFRAEMAGEPRGPELWRELSGYASQWFPSPGIAFADVHAALAHAFAGDATPWQSSSIARRDQRQRSSPLCARVRRLQPLGMG